MYLIVVNYRGSPGFGKDGVDSLLGKVGTQDISDVHVSKILHHKLLLLHYLTGSLQHCM